MKIDTRKLSSLLAQVVKDSAAHDEAMARAMSLPYPPVTEQEKRLEHDIAHALWKRAATVLMASTRAYEAALAEIADPDNN